METKVLKQTLLFVCFLIYLLIMVKYQGEICKPQENLQHQTSV